jgi:KAP family P-loop domain/Common central domain of tyrosinase
MSAIGQSKAGVRVRARRSVDELSERDLARLRDAFEAMMAARDERGYQHWAGIHGLPPPIHGEHGSLSFLPWHRAYLAQFELALGAFAPGVSVPWWDWASEDAHRTGIPQAYAAERIAGRPNPLYAAQIDSLNWGVQDAGGGDIPSYTTREPGEPSRLPGAEDVERLLETDDFGDFATQLEMLHNKVHAWVGGTNGMVAVSAYDPFSWAYQASVDRIWWLWQQRHPAHEPPSEIAGQALSPFSITVADAWNTADLGYGYAVSTQLLAGATCDLPTTRDELDFADYADAFAEIIGSPYTSLPLTIGIYGSWGIGKSSLLQMIAGEFPSGERADDEVDVHVVEFNAWRYDSGEKIWPALVRQIMECMESGAQWSFWDRFKDTLGRNVRRLWRQRRNQLTAGLALVALAGIVIWALGLSAAVLPAALAVVGVPGLLKIGIEASNSPVSGWVGTLVAEGEYGGELPYMREIHADLRFLTGRLRAGRADPRVLVMIDDLDRCEPTKAVEVLQAINLLLDFPIFIVCLGIDARIITAAVEGHYEQLLGQAGASGYEYLDKIVQIPFRIPRASEPEIERFIESQMPVTTKLDGDMPSARLDASTASREPSADAAVPEPAPSVPEADRRETAASLDASMFDEAEVAAFQKLSPYMRRNPRHVKRLVNVYRLVRTLAIRREAGEILDKPSLTISWILICAQWPYTVSAMLEAFEEIVERAGEGHGYPDGHPLTKLYERASRTVSAELQLQIDDDLDDLRKLLRQTPLSWAGLNALQPFTLNFNPAIEEALRRGRGDAVDGSAPNRPKAGQRTRKPARKAHASK